MIGRPLRTFAVTAAVLLLAALAITRLESTPSTSLLVGASTATARSGDSLDRAFGGEPIVVSLNGDLERTLDPANLLKLVALEGRLARLPGVRSVYGPGTFVNQTIVQTDRIMSRELGGLSARAEAAASRARGRARAAGAPAAIVAASGDAAFRAVVKSRAQDYADLLVRLGSVGAPALSNRTFVGTLVFGAGVTPKKRFQWLFPDAGHALILVRPRPGLQGEPALALGERIRRLASASGLDGIRVSVAGAPLLAAALERETRAEILRLAPVAFVAMLLLLLVVLRRRRGRLISLGLAAGATTLALGLSWVIGLGLSVATVAAMPVMVGLALDFAVQVQARYWRERADGRSPAMAATLARQDVGPTLALAAGAMSVGFVALTLSAVPILDRLGILLALGTGCGLAFALVVGPPLLAAVDQGGVQRPLDLALPAWVRAMSPAPALLGALAVLALGGLVMSGATTLESDVRSLAPAGLKELQAVERVQRAVGTGGQVSVAIRARDVSDPAVLRWMAKVRAEITAGDRRLRPGPNLADLVVGPDPSVPLDVATVQRMLRLLPRYFLDGVVTRDRTLAQMSFGVPFVSVSEQAGIARRVQALTANPPPGVSATPAGLVVEAAQSQRALERLRPWLLLLSITLIGLILMGAWRRADRVAVVLAPAVLAAGLSALLLVVTGLRLSPLGAALEPLVLAVGIEFGVLLDMRYRQARDAGRTPAQARDDATREIGGAVSLSAVTVAVGFGVLVASRLPLLSQFGWLVAVEIAVCLVAALLVVPAMCEWCDLPSGVVRRPVPGRALVRRVAR
jgi:hydrophobe/amphiphile efflux-3 (HAE3) family protein